MSPFQVAEMATLADSMRSRYLMVWDSTTHHGGFWAVQPTAVFHNFDALKITMQGLEYKGHPTILGFGEDVDTLGHYGR